MIKVKIIEFNVGITFNGVVKTSFNSEDIKNYQVNLYSEGESVYIEDKQARCEVKELPKAGNVRTIIHYGKTVNAIQETKANTNSSSAKAS